MTVLARLTALMDAIWLDSFRHQLGRRTMPWSIR